MADDTEQSTEEGVPEAAPGDSASSEMSGSATGTSSNDVESSNAASTNIAGSKDVEASKPTSVKQDGPGPGYVFLIVVTLVNLVADLWSKWWAKSHFEAVRPKGERRVVVIEDVMNFIFAKNRGGAWGLLQDETEALRRPFFLIVSVAAIVFIVSLYRKLQPGQTALKWGLPLVLGGALGNLVDRIRYGYVVDFIDVYMSVDGKVRHWPTFNVADVSICVGVALMAIDMFTSRTPAPTAKPPAKADPVPPAAPLPTSLNEGGAGASSDTTG
jgi:signal peptidase II